MTREEFIKAALTHPPDFGYHGDLPLFEPGGWGFTPFGVHRDSDVLDRANWETISEDLQERFPDSFEVVHCNHWAVGWMDHLAVDTTDDKAIDAAMEWMDKLADYPVADEMKYSEMELEETDEAWDSWGRDDCHSLIREACLDYFLDEDDYVRDDLSEEDEEAIRQAANEAGFTYEHGLYGRQRCDFIENLERYVLQKRHEELNPPGQLDLFEESG